MNCGFCGTENPEDAVFCKACGKRLDGLATCPDCGQTIPADSVFCPYCGVKQQAVSAAAARYEIAAAAAEEEGTEEKRFTAKKVLKYVSASAALATSLFSLIFVFLIGLVATQTVSATGVKLSTEKIDIFYYFGKAYKDIDKALNLLLEAYKGYSGYSESCLYIPAAYGTVFAALTIIAVCALSVAGIVYSIRFLAGKSEKTGGTFAIAAYLTYVAGAVAILSIDNCSINYFQNSNFVSANVKFNGATVAGITLGAIFAAAYAGCTIASRGKEILKAQSLVKLILSVAGIALTVVIFVLCARPALSVDAEDMSAHENASLSVLLLLEFLAGTCADVDTYKIVLNAETVAAYSAVAFVMLVLTIVFASRLLTSFVRGTTNGDKKTDLVSAIILTVCALLFMVFTIVAAKEFLNALDYIAIENEVDSVSEEVSFTYAIPITVFVLSAVALAVTITQKCLLAKYKNQMEN